MEHAARGTVLALGERHLLEGFALAGVELIAADTPEDVLSAWRQVGEVDGLVFLTPEAAEVIGVSPAETTAGPMIVVLPR
jgi:vacuolar-type H+-ATPase subunit F/Vma7